MFLDNWHDCLGTTNTWCTCFPLFRLNVFYQASAIFLLIYSSILSWWLFSTVLIFLKVFRSGHWKDCSNRLSVMCGCGQWSPPCFADFFIREHTHTNVVWPSSQSQLFHQRWNNFKASWGNKRWLYYEKLPVKLRNETALIWGPQSI